MPKQLFSVAVVCCLIVFVHCTGSEVTDDVRNDDVTENRRSPDSSDEVCLTCASQEVLHRLPQADIIQLHVERIKRELLRKLGLSTAPNVTGKLLLSASSFPSPLVSATAEKPGGDVTDEEGVFPDDGVDYDRPADDDDDHEDDEEDSFDGESKDDDDDDDANGPPAASSTSKHIIVFGQQRMLTYRFCE